MAAFVQADRPFRMFTPLGPDALLLVGFNGHEAISELFEFQLDALAENATNVAFDKLLGQKVAIDVLLPNGNRRFFNGVCNRVTQGARDPDFTAYRLQIVPQFWLLTKRSQSRIFQHVTVPDILKKVLAGLDVDFRGIQGKFEPRDYCVQYRESDFAFASRLMEEEGIFYFFTHSASGHTMVLADTPQGHPDLPEESSLIFEVVEGGEREENRVLEWRKAQELRSGKVTLWDHCFELPYQHLDAEKTIPDGVAVGQVTHKLRVGGNDKLELYDFPGGYAQRFDGIDRGGGERSAELQKIFEDNQRTAGIRMQEEAAAGLALAGVSTVRQLVSGHKFKLTRHFDSDGPYVLRRVEHHAKATSDFRSGEEEQWQYDNTFACIPFAQPFRPPRVTPKALVQGAQTATVVGPSGEEIFTDKYGRVKVQFHWDREGKHDADSSCWIRVGTIWAGKTWGIVNVPRIGHEVIVAFLEGDPDQPIIVGSVHNADHVPPGELPKAKMVSGLRSNSTPGGGGYNGLIFDDTKGKEKITLHGQYDMDSTIEHDQTLTVRNDRTTTIEGKLTETIIKDTKITIAEGKYEHAVATGTASYYVKSDLTEFYDATQATSVTADQATFVGGNQSTTVTKSIAVTSKEADILHTAATVIKLQVGKSSLTMDKSGRIELSGVDILINGTSTVTVDGAKILITGGQETKIGVSSQNVVCDATRVTTSGTAINSSAVGIHEITGAVVKIN